MYFNPYSNITSIQNARNFLPISRVLDIPRATNLTTSITPAVKKFSWGTFFNGASKTISTINQALPLYNQVKPIFNNAKTVINVFRNFNKVVSQPITEPLEEEEEINLEASAPPKNEKDIIDVPSIIVEERIETSPTKPFFNW